MKTRSLTPKLFARSKIGSDPIAFLERHMSWLRSHRFIAPILDAYVEGEISPLPTIGACREALLTHEIRMGIAKAQESLKKSIAKIGEDAYTITVYCKTWDKASESFQVAVGQVEHRHLIEDEHGLTHVETTEEEMVYEARLYQAAERIAVLRLSKREDSLFAEITNTMGPRITTRIDRDQALGLMFPRERTQFQKRVGRGESAPFKNFPRARNTHSIGPWNVRLPV